MQTSAQTSQNGRVAKHPFTSLSDHIHTLVATDPFSSVAEHEIRDIQPSLNIASDVRESAQKEAFAPFAFPPFTSIERAFETGMITLPFFMFMCTAGLIRKVKGEAGNRTL